VKGVGHQVFVKIPGERQSFGTVGDDEDDEVAIAKETRELLKCNVNHRVTVKSVTTPEREDVMYLCNKAEHWLRSKILQPTTLPSKLKLSYEIWLRTQVLNLLCRRILGGIIKNKVTVIEEDLADSEYDCEADKSDLMKELDSESMVKTLVVVMLISIVKGR